MSLGNRRDHIGLTRLSNPFSALMRYQYLSISSIIMKLMVSPSSSVFWFFSLPGAWLTKVA